ncbi:hypothetical protein D9756_008134 [Leucocoprinus leucothites]|uniref:Carrier domain-containing protein n=1 Tax=Leucocoprinus leucothites TaxID=201217 RepID=A0A8H5FYC4_9AGAR|nr:hypothetical protein D9756_008134 [Leucoagaricus leucothites]
MPAPALTGLPVVPSDPVKLDHVAIWDVYRQLGINFGDRVFARTMDADNDDVPIENITYKKLFIDSMKVASVLKEKLGSEEKLTYAMLATSSYAYLVSIVAGWLNHWTVILLSVRNSVAGNDSLLKAVNAKAIITDNKNRKAAEAILEGLPITLLDVLDPEQINIEIELPKGPIEVEAVSPEVFKEVPLYLHSSGTSGHPKPIPQSHEHIMTDMIAMRTNTNYVGAPVYAPLPLFHGIGLYCFTRWPIAAGHIPTFISTKLPLTSTSLLHHLRRLPGALCFLAPMLLEDALREPPEECKILSTTRRIFYGGAPLDKAAGKQLIEMGAPIVQLFGTTEISMLVVTDFPGPPETRGEDVQYVKFRDDQYVLHWEPFDGKLSELIVCPGKIAVPAVLNHKNPVGYATNDLWEPHPTIPGLFKHCGRKDLVTVLSNGEKTDNRQLELLLMDDPFINGVVVFGTGRPLNGILIRQDPKTSPFPSQSAFIDAIWPTIEHLNTIVPNHSRVIRQMVVVADSEKKPFIQSDKGSIKNKETIALYKDEIDAAYASLEAESGEEVVKDIDTPEQIEGYIRDVVSKVAKRPIGDSDDFFESGLDSLHAVQIRTEIKPLFSKFVKGEELMHNVAYVHPTVSQLSAYLIARSKGEVINLDDPAIVASRVEACIERWTANMPERKASTAPVPQKKTFALTGSTGSLGVHTLRYLLERDDVEKVYCFHRGASDLAIQRQKKLFYDRTLPVELLDSDKVAFVQIDLSKPDLGLSTEKYDELRGSLTHIVHTAWELNFNWGLERFEKVHVGGTRHLIDLSIASTLPVSPRVIFISSIGVVSRHDPEVPVPEEPLPDPALIGSRGYGEAKYVCERMLDEAVRRASVPVTVIRSGQIAGSSLDGYWAPTEYMPTIFRSSMVLGKVPNKLPDTRWLPADYCGKAVMELSLHDEGDLLQYYSLENPTGTPWSTIASLFIEVASTKMEQVDTKDWLAAVEQANKEGVDIPASALLQFYSEYSEMDSRIRLGTEKAARASKAIQYGPVTSELMRKYISWV